MSGKKGAQFTLSLKDTNRDRDGAVEVARINGICGLILANQVSNTRELGFGGTISRKGADNFIGFPTWIMMLLADIHDIFPGTRA